MTGVAVTVHGEHTAHLPPERATVHARVALEGSTAAEVLAAATASAASLTSSIERLHHPDTGPVTRWAGDEVRTSVHRPWHDKGRQLPLVHTARIGYRVRFRDFSELGPWLGRAAEVPGFIVERVEWTLTEARRDEVLRQVRAEAVRAAVVKAQAYADALDLGPVRVVEIADAGMLGEGRHPTDGGDALFARVGSAGGAEESLALVPEDVAVEASVDARFVTG